MIPRILHRFIDGVEVKRCSHCEQWLPLGDFGKRADGWDGLRSGCRACCVSSAAKYRAEHPEKVRASQAKWREEHREEQRAYAAKYRVEHPEKIGARQAKWRAENPDYMIKYRAEHREERLAYNAKWREENPEYFAKYAAGHREERRSNAAKYYAEHHEYYAKYAAVHRKEARTRAARWRAENPDRRRANQSRRRALKNGATVKPVTAEDLDAICAEYGGICPYCNERIEDGHFDHVVPLSGGGEHSTDNLVWCCASCNLQKNAKSLLTFLLYWTTMAEAIYGFEEAS